MTRTEAVAFRARIETAAQRLPDAQAVNSTDLFPVWSGCRSYAQGERVRCRGRLYRCHQAITANPAWTPDVTPAHWEPVTAGEDGTRDKPITAAAGMRYFKDLYYAQGDAVYLCIRDDSDGGGTLLPYLPSQLVGIYFEEVTSI